MLAAGACSRGERKENQHPVNNKKSLASRAEAPCDSTPIQNRKAGPILEPRGVNDSSDSDYRNDSLAIFFKKQYEVEYFKSGKDTLELVMGSDIPYYPFGHCRNVNCVKSRLSKFIFHAERDTTNEPVELHRGAFKNSFIKMMYDPEKKQMQIVSGKINDSEVVLFNNISTGMPEEIFIALFIQNDSFIRGKRPGVIQLTSVVNGISHFYTFDKGALKSIAFETDYALNKN